jgi:hypothetical protein
MQRTAAAALRSPKSDGLCAPPAPRPFLTSGEGGHGPLERAGWASASRYGLWIEVDRQPTMK